MSSIQEFVPKFWVQYVFNLDFVLKFRIRIEVFVLDKAFLGFCFETCWLFVVFFFAGCLVKRVRSALELCETEC